MVRDIACATAVAGQSGYPPTVVFDAARDAIVGLWRLVSYEDRENATHAWTQTGGEQPRGLAVYHSSGILSVQLFGSPGSDSVAYHVGYIGTFSVRHHTGWGLQPYFRHRGGEHGDILLAVFELASRIATLHLGDEELLHGVAGGRIPLDAPEE